MKSINTNSFSLFLCFLLLCSFSKAICQTTEPIIDHGKRYDELLNKKLIEPTVSPSPVEEETNKAVIDELVFLLPQLDNILYDKWAVLGEPKIQKEGNKELLIELGIEKTLSQTYMKENHNVDVIIYKFKDFAGAYSAYTVLHSGASTKLKVGKNASESESAVNFWKGNYYVDLHTQSVNDNAAKEFIILASQDISKNIQADQLPPVVAIQLPALNRVQASEKYCTGELCCSEFISKALPDFNCSSYNLKQSGGIIRAEYQLSDDVKDRITFILTRYTDKESAELVFNSLKKYFEDKQKENKEIDIDIDLEDSIVKVKNKKNDYTMLKQKGNLLAIAYFITNKKTGEQILGLVPWPIEVSKPISKEATPSPANEN